MLMRVLIPLFLLSWLTACATEVIVEKPVVVEVEVVKWTPIPTEFTVESPKSVIPDTLTYGEAISLWSVDRSTLDILNGRLRGIQELSDELP